MARRRLSRDEVLVKHAALVAERSTCLRSQVGAVIAREGRIISTGYNGTPSGMPHCTPTDCGPDHPCTKTVHAEANAIAFAARYGIKVEGSTLYTQISPCNDCAKLIINSGIRRVVFQDYYRDGQPLVLLADAGVNWEWHG
ncbi:deoxycytidylate deaminase [[Eubacterium] cellulosolvens]